MAYQSKAILKGRRSPNHSPSPVPIKHYQSSNQTDIIGRSHFPDTEKLTSILAALTKSLMGNENIPNAPMLTPPPICYLGARLNLDNPLNSKLRWSDLDSKLIRTGSINRLLAALSCDYMRAVGLNPPITSATTPHPAIWTSKPLVSQNRTRKTTAW